MEDAVTGLRSLTLDTSWVEIQKNTFKNWCNACLKSRNMSINDITTDFRDGVKLINLYEVLRKKTINRYHKTPKMSTQMLENVTLVLQAMEKDNVHLVNIGTEDIVNGNEKLILGLIWRMILHYQIGSVEVAEKPVQAQSTSTTSSVDVKRVVTVKVMPKHLLLHWVQRVIPEMKVGNLTTDWNSGIVLGALVEKLAPNSCPDFRSWNPRNGYENVSVAMQAAEDYLGIPKVISESHMASPSVDELSMMTYLSYFTQDGGIGEKYMIGQLRMNFATLKVNNFTTDWNDGTALCHLVECCAPGSIPYYPRIDPERPIYNLSVAMQAAEQVLGIKPVVAPEVMASPDVPALPVMWYVSQFQIPPPRPPSPKINHHERIKIYGDGASRPVLGETAEFVVVSEVPLEKELLDVSVKRMAGNMSIRVPTTVRRVSDTKFACDYTVDEPGEYVISVKYNRMDVVGTPITTEFVAPRIDLRKVKLEGNDFRNAVIGENIDLFLTMDKGQSKVECFLEDTPGSRLPVSVTNCGDGRYKLTYSISKVGIYKLRMFVDGQELLFEDMYTRVGDPEKVFVDRQQGDDRVLINEFVHYRVDPSTAGVGTLTAETFGPDRNTVPTNIIQNDDGSYTISFKPKVVGDHYTSVFWNYHEIPGSPIEISVFDPSQVKAYGEGLLRAKVNSLATFEVNVEGAGLGSLSGSIGSGNQTSELEFLKIGPTLFQAQYVPQINRPHQVSVLLNGFPVKGCPFNVDVCDPSQIKVLSNERPIAGQKFAYTVCIPSKAGRGTLQCTVDGPRGSVPVDIVTVDQNTQYVEFTPDAPGTYKTGLCFNGHPVPGFPQVLNVEVQKQRGDASKVVAFGEALERLQYRTNAVFEVSTAGAGNGELVGKVEANGEFVPIEFHRIDENLYQAQFPVWSMDPHRVILLYDGAPVKGSPWTIDVVDPSQVQVIPNVIGQVPSVDEEYAYKIIVPSKAGKGYLQCHVEGPRGVIQSDILKSPDGTLLMRFKPNVVGMYQVNMTYAGYGLTGFPQYINVLEKEDPIDATKVALDVSGLRNSTVGETSKGIIDGHLAGPGVLSLWVVGPTGEVPVKVVSLGDSRFEMSFSPSVSGQHDIHVRWSDKPVPGTPLRVIVQPRSDPTRVVVSGPGIKEGIIGQPWSFLLDSRGAGPGTLTCWGYTPSCQPAKIIIHDNQDGTYEIELVTNEPGIHIIEVAWNDTAIPGSPFQVKIHMPPDPSKVKVSGPGIMNGVINNYNGTFQVETLGAGYGVLKVIVHGPKGAFDVELLGDRPRSRTVDVRYNPQDVGHYKIVVLWADQNVPGSPFSVYIAGSKENNNTLPSARV